MSDHQEKPKANDKPQEYGTKAAVQGGRGTGVEREADDYARQASGPEGEAAVSSGKPATRTPSPAAKGDGKVEGDAEEKTGGRTFREGGYAKARRDQNDH